MLRTNLQPKIKAETKAGFQMPIWAPIMLGIIVIAGIGGSWWYLTLTINDLNSQKTSVQRKLQDFQALIRDEESMREDRDYLKDKLTYIRSLYNNQAQWTYFLDTFKDNIPEDVWVQNMKVTEEGQLEIEGATYTYSAVGHFIIRLEAMPQLNGVALAQASSTARGSSEAGAPLETKMRKDFKITATTSLLGASSKPQKSTTQGSTQGANKNVKAK
jgi:Tfp pilus assembly protein PilN